MIVLVLLASVFGLMLFSTLGFVIIALVMNEFYNKKEGNP
jgi:hypothetical protein